MFLSLKLRLTFFPFTQVRKGLNNYILILSIHSWLIYDDDTWHHYDLVDSLRFESAKRLNNF